jgi:hypothetical protein
MKIAPTIFGGRSRRGLTFVELTIGMAISAVIMLALASFVSAVGRGWKNSEEQFKARSVSHQSVAQLRDVLSNMLCVVQTKVGDTAGSNAYLFCWYKDSWGGAADLKAQWGEMALIEYEPSTKTVWIYLPKDVSAMTAQQKGYAELDDWGDYSSDSIVSLFRASAINLPRRPLVGGATDNGGASVSSAQFGYFAATNGKPVASYQLTLVTDGAFESACDNVPFRAAQQPTNLTLDDD